MNIRIPDPGSEFFPSWILWTKKHRIQDPEPGSAALPAFPLNRKDLNVDHNMGLVVLNNMKS
jgi:hypothetical protein